MIGIRSIFAKILLLLEFHEIYGSLAVLRGKVVEHSYYYDERRLLCVSEDDGAGLIWNGNLNWNFNSYAFSDRGGQIAFHSLNSYAKTVLDCEMDAYKACMTSWEISNWSLTNSIVQPMGPVFDRRWENFREFNNFHGYNEYRRVDTLSKTGSMAFSIRGTTDAHLLFCDSEQYESDFCYWIIIGGWHNTKSVIRKCPNGVPYPTTLPKNECANEQASYNHTALSPSEWKTFILTWNATTRNFTLYDPDNIIMTFTDFGTKPSNTTNDYHIFLRSTMPLLYRPHTYSFYQTSDSSATLTSTRLNLNSPNFCMQALVGLCFECQLEISLIDAADEGASEILDIVDGSKIITDHRLPMWQYVRVNKLVSFHLEDGIKVRFTPKLNGVSDRPVWAVADIRVCPPLNVVRYGVMEATQDYYDSGYHWPNVTCQKLFYNNNSLVSSIPLPIEDLEFDDLYCPEGTVGPHCSINCQNHLENDADCRGSVICKEGGCTCSLGFTGDDCRSNCNVGRYGHGCKETCGWCKDENCNYKTGVCISGCDNSKRYNIPPFCKAGIDRPPSPEIDFVNETTVRVILVAREAYKEASASYLFQIHEEGQTSVSSIGEMKRIFKNETVLVGYVDVLHPGTNYLINCVLFVENNDIQIKGEWGNFSTRCTPTLEFDVTVNETSVTVKNKQIQKSVYSCPEKWYHMVLRKVDSNVEVYSGNLPDLPYKVSNLMPYTDYKLVISKRNATLFYHEFRTPEGAPTKVRNIEKELSSNRQVILKWEKPEYPNGIVTNYEVTLTVETFFGCRDFNMWPRRNNTISKFTNITHVTFTELQPYVHYVVKVRAHTSKRGDEASIEFSTEQREIPSAILSNLRFLDFALFWDPPVDCATISGPIPVTKVIIDGVSESVKHYHDTRQTKSAYLKLGAKNDAIYGAEQFRVRIYALRDYHKVYNETQYCELIFQTPPTSPPSVKNFEIFETDLKHSRTSLRWQKPEPPLNGEIEHYVIVACISTCQFVQKILPNRSCEIWEDYLCTTIKQPGTQFRTIGIAAANANVTAPGKMSFVSIVRKEEEPKEPTNFEIQLLDKGVINLTWSHPWKTGGHLDRFSIHVEILSTRLKMAISLMETNGTYEVEVPKYQLEYREELHLLPSCTYEISICGITNTNTHGKARKTILSTPSAIAFKGELTSEVDNDDSTIFLHIPTLANDTKDSLMSIIVRATHSCEQHTQLSLNLRELIGIREHECAWIAATFPAEDYAGKVFRVGDNHHYNGTTNSPLKREESYAIAIIVQTDGGSMNDQIMLGKTTSIRIGELTKRHDVAWLLPILIFLLFAVSAYYFYRRRRRSSIKNIILQDEMPLEQNNGSSETKSVLSDSKQLLSGSTSSCKEPQSRLSTPEIPSLTTDDLEKQEGTSPVKVKDFQDYVRNAIESGLLDKQYALFPRGQTKPWDYGKLPQNKSKNRYGNLIAYDESRVVLKNLSDDPYSDYINANYIRGYKKERCYIATQGPKPTTVIDFWRMIWQEEVLIICMLANVIESGKLKCEQYWPDIGKKKKYGDVVVFNAKHKVFADYILRTLQVTCGDETRQIEHLHYTAWPDHSVPLYTHSVVTYLKKLLAIPPGNGPIVVHCSAGVGRTGTIILCDLCLRRAAAEGVVDVFAEIEAIRSQRANMVDNKQQYLLAHLAIVECLLSFPTTLPCNESLPSKIRELKKQLAYQQQRLQSTAWQDEALRPPTMQTVLSERNIAKNRFPELLSAKINRIYLKRYPPTDEDSDYLSAVYVDGVRVQNQYLAAQLPLPSTFNDFWRMIAEFKVELIIMLQPPDPEDPTCCPIVPCNEFKPTPYINVTFKDSGSFEHYSTRRLTLLDNSEKPTRDHQVTILSLNEWQPGRNQPPPEVMSMVTLWQAAERIPRGEGPVVVLCHDGVTGCGLYLALSFLLERMSVEGECDVCLAIRAIRRSRPDFVQSLEHMEYLYDGAITYLEYFETYANFT